MSDGLATSNPQTSWPVLCVFLAIVFGWLSCQLLTPSLCGPERESARALTQTGVAVIFVARLVWADQRKERSRIWIVYVGASLLAVPLWLGLEAILDGCS